MTHTHTHMHTYTYTQHTCIHTHTHKHTHTHTHNTHVYTHTYTQHITYMCWLRQSELSWCFAPSILASIVVDTPWAAKWVGISPCVGIKTLTGTRFTAGECEGPSKQCVHSNTTTVYTQLQPLPYKVLHIFECIPNATSVRAQLTNSIQDKQEAIHHRQQYVNVWSTYMRV